MPIHNFHFLVAEDHRFQRRMLVRMLADLGAKIVHEADDGHAALAILRDPDHTVDIVICDLDMPGMDGMEFIRHLATVGPHVSIIILSALERALLASVATMTEAYGIKLLGVVQKPVTSGKLEPLIKLHQTAENPESAAAASLVFPLDEIMAGLKEDQFEPFYQPKVELASGRVRGAEALARWRHPRLGLVPPFAFIQLLEDSDHIDELTWAMLTKSAAFCSAWRMTGEDVTVSVNLSTKSLADPQLAERVMQLVREQNVEPQHMVLEVTETSATKDVGSTLENLARLRMRGFGLSIDDYGTGYSSMQQLMRIAFTELKIDQTFVAHATEKENAKVMLESSIDTARKLGIAVVAEGVETQAGWDLLQKLNCDLAQGYFIARPMEEAEFLDWIQGWNQSK